ncbi:MAG: response regulator transcription factor [Pseudomonadota bacterium]
MQAKRALEMKQTVYVVDDDDLFRESLSRNLVAFGHYVRTYSDGQTFLDHVDESEGGVILLDWKMPGLNGIEVLQTLRESGNQMPVIFLTVLGDQIYEEAALAGGAVDFIEKSRSFSIVQRRIELILQGNRAQPNNDKAQREELITVGQMVVDNVSRRIRWKDIDVPLTLTEFKMVRYMAEQDGRDVDYRSLYDLVHGEGFTAGEGEHGYRANVRAFIKRIRQKFRAVDDTFDCIGNYPGFGYRWQSEGAGSDA